MMKNKRTSTRLITVGAAAEQLGRMFTYKEGNTLINVEPETVNQINILWSKET